MKKFTPGGFLSMALLVTQQHAVSRFLLISIFIRVIKFSRISKYVYVINYASIKLKMRVLRVITLVFLFLVRCRFPTQFLVSNQQYPLIEVWRKLSQICYKTRKNRFQTLQGPNELEIFTNLFENCYSEIFEI